MKTSLVVKGYGAGPEYRRARAPSDNGPGDFTGVPAYIAAHQANGIRSDGRTTWREPEAVHAVSGIFRPEHGKLDRIRFADGEFVQQLESIDARREELKRQLAELQREEQNVLEDAYIRGKPLTVAQAKQWRADRDASKLPQPATLAPVARP